MIMKGASLQFWISTSFGKVAAVINTQEIKTSIYFFFSYIHVYCAVVGRYYYYYS